MRVNLTSEIKNLMINHLTDSISHNTQIVLASSSEARRKVLEKLEIPFDVFKPSIDETPKSGESPHQLVKRLSVEKALAAADCYPEHLVIGSDQVAVVDAQILGKPANRECAISQLELMSQKEVVLLTGLALINTATGNVQSDVIPYRVEFRNLKRAMIENYIDKDKPYDCGGSLRSEGLGVALLKRFDGTDPNALLGLPLIRLIDMLASEGVSIL